MTDRLLPEIGSGLPDNGRCGRARVIRLEEFSPAEPLHPRSLEAFERRVLTLLDGGEAVRRGGFAEVRLVRNVWGEAFALKTPHLLDGATKAKAAVEDAFRREYQLFCRMSGIKGFPRVYGMGTVDGKLAILMEWVEGIPLGKAARILSVDDEGRMSPLAAARVGRDLFELLSRMSVVDGNIVHGDVSPSNVLVRTDRISLAEQVDEGAFDLCIVDFGSAQMLDSSCESYGSQFERFVPASSATPEFAAPEFLGSRSENASPAIGPHCDVYAATSVVFQLVVGQPPFGAARGEDPDVLADRKRYEAPAPFATCHINCDGGAISAYEPEVAVDLRLAAAGLPHPPSAEESRAALLQLDAQLDELLASCLSPVPEQRPSARKMRDALGAFSFHYRDNLENALRGAPLVPCVPGSLADGYGETVRARRSAVRVGLKAACAIIALGIVIASAVVVGRTPCAFGNLSAISSGPGASVAAVMLAALPFAGGGVAYMLRSKLRRPLPAIGLGVCLGAVFSFLCLVSFGPVGSDVALMLGSGICALSAAMWLFFALGVLIPDMPEKTPESTASQPRALMEPSASEAIERKVF